MRNICFTTGGPNPFKGAQSASLIELRQTGAGSFTVIYGLDVTRGLSYREAARALGACIMHMAACNGTLDNSP